MEFEQQAPQTSTGALQDVPLESSVALDGTVQVLMLLALPGQQYWVETERDRPPGSTNPLWRVVAVHQEEHERKDESELYAAHVTDLDYVRHYRVAVEPLVVCLIALYEVYARLKDGRVLTDGHRTRFLSVVQDDGPQEDWRGDYDGMLYIMAGEKDFDQYEKQDRDFDVFSPPALDDIRSIDHPIADPP